MFKKRLASVIGAVLTCSMLLAGCGGAGDSGSAGNGGNADKEKPTVTLMIEIGGYAPLEKAVQMVKDKFPEYNIVSKEWSIDGVKKAIKTTQASGGNESIDIAFNSATGILGFAEAGLLENLSPYLEEDAEWGGALKEEFLTSCIYKDDVYGVPWQAAYPVIVANKDIFDECNIEIKDNWTYDELIDVCEKLKKKGYFAFCVNDNSSWLIRQSYLNGFKTEEELNDFNQGKISMHDDMVVEAFDRVKALYDNNYCYLGEGAIAATADECKVGFTNEKVAMCMTTNGGASSLIAECGIENAQIVNFPSFSNYSTEYLLGAPDVYIVPSNAKNKEAVIEVLKYLTGEEVLTAMAQLGTVVPLKEVKVDDPNYAEYSRDLGRLHTEDFANLSDEIGDYISNGSAVTNYLYDGDVALDDLEQMRKAAIEK